VKMFIVYTVRVYLQYIQYIVGMCMNEGLYTLCSEDVYSEGMCSQGVYKMRACIECVQPARISPKPGRRAGSQNMGNKYIQDDGCCLGGGVGHIHSILAKDDRQVELRGTQLR
jgi:hypothetical protein